MKAALKKSGPIQVRLPQPNIREKRSAAVEMHEKAAFNLIKKGSIKLGLGKCRVRLQATSLRCFRCLAYGHIADNCKRHDQNRLENLQFHWPRDNKHYGNIAIAFSLNRNREKEKNSTPLISKIFLFIIYGVVFK